MHWNWRTLHNKICPTRIIRVQISPNFNCIIFTTLLTNGKIFISTKWYFPTENNFCSRRSVRPYQINSFFFLKMNVFYRTCLEVVLVNHLARQWRQATVEYLVDNWRVGIITGDFRVKYVAGSWRPVASAIKQCRYRNNN